MTREEAIKIISQMIKDEEGFLSDDTVEAHKMAIKALEQKPKTGHWIDDKCSVCGKGIEDLIDSREWYRNEEPNFCPFCGVRVVESETETWNGIHGQITAPKGTFKKIFDDAESEDKE